MAAHGGFRFQGHWVRAKNQGTSPDLTWAVPVNPINDDPILIAVEELGPSQEKHFQVFYVVTKVKSLKTQGKTAQYPLHHTYQKPAGATSVTEISFDAGNLFNTGYVIVECVLAQPGLRCCSDVSMLAQVEPSLYTAVPTVENPYTYLSELMDLLVKQGYVTLSGSVGAPGLNRAAGVAAIAAGTATGMNSFAALKGNSPSAVRNEHEANQGVRAIDVLVEDLYSTLNTTGINIERYWLPSRYCIIGVIGGVVIVRGKKRRKDELYLYYEIIMSHLDNIPAEHRADVEFALKEQEGYLRGSMSAVQMTLVETKRRWGMPQ
jgi:hypothetical protein